MKKEEISKISFDDHLGCFGNFRRTDKICNKLCALRLRCAIEHDQNIRLELFDDLFGEDGIVLKIQ